MNFLIKLYDQFSIFINRAKSSFLDLYSLTFVRIFSAISILINLFLWYFTWYIYKNISQDIAVLHYNVEFGIDQVGNKSYFFIIPLLSLFFILINNIAFLILFKKEDFKFLAYFLLSFLLFFNILLSFFLVSIYLINF